LALNLTKYLAQQEKDTILWALRGTV